MNNFEHYLLILMVVLTAFDRVMLRRKNVVLHRIGAAHLKPEALAFPITLDVRRGWLSDARVEYSLQDLKNPSVVIAGKTRAIDTSRKGRREEFLLINSRYIESGLWDLRVRVINGNCRLNPLYRIFPLVDFMEKQYRITSNGEGGWHVE